MEGRAHPSDNSSLTRQVSRLKQDLSSSRHIPHIIGINANMMRRSIPKGYIPHVCIVGAGVSGNQLSLLTVNLRFQTEESITLGLRCAEVLIKKGVKVSILEGRNRVGGRVGYNLME